MDIIIPTLIASVLGYSIFGDEEKQEENLPVNELKITESNGINEYIKNSQLSVVKNAYLKPETYVNTSILNNPGFKPVMNNLYFFKNYYQLTIKKYKIEGEKVTTDANINLSIDSPKILNYTDGQVFEYDNSKYFDGIIIRAQLLPLSDNENKFTLIYEIENTEAQIKKSNFSQKSAGSVINSLVDKDVSEKESYKVLENGWHMYTGRIYSIDEKIIDINSPIFFDIGNYRIEMKLNKGKESELYSNPSNILCKNKICEQMKMNTILKKKKNST